MATEHSVGVYKHRTAVAVCGKWNVLLRVVGDADNCVLLFCSGVSYRNKHKGRHAVRDRCIDDRRAEINLTRAA